MSVTLSGKKEKSKSKSESKPYFESTGFSNISGRNFTLDPSIRNLQESGASAFGAGRNQFSEAVGKFGGAMGELRSRLFGNEDPYMRARTAPTEERFAQERGALQRDIGRRGLAGSSFGQQAQTSQAVAQERALADQRALAVNESINAGMTIDQLILQAEQAAAAGNMEQANFLRGIANDRANTELGIFGLGTQAKGSASGTQIGASGTYEGGGGGN